MVWPIIDNICYTTNALYLVNIKAHSALKSWVLVIIILLVDSLIMSELGEYTGEEPSYSEYIHEDINTGEVVRSPFAVYVFGANGENLGVGLLVGAINDHDCQDSPEAVIVIDDPEDQYGNVTMTTEDCSWVYIDTTDEELMNRIATNLINVVPARQYLDGQDDLSWSIYSYCLEHTANRSK